MAWAGQVFGSRRDLVAVDWFWRTGRNWTGAIGKGVGQGQQECVGYSDGFLL